MQLAEKSLWAIRGRDMGSCFTIPGMPSAAELCQISHKMVDLGYIGEPDTQAGTAKQIGALLNPVIGGPMLYLALSPHTVHNTVDVIEDLSSAWTVVADGVIYPKSPFAYAVTCVADCATVGVYGNDHLAFLHVGWPELLDGVVEEFGSKWRAIEPISEARAVIGPCIAGEHLELGPEVLDRAVQLGLKRFITTTVWNTLGLDLLGALIDRLQQQGLLATRIWASGEDTYGSEEYPSYRRCKHQGVRTPRNAFVFRI